MKWQAIQLSEQLRPEVEGSLEEKTQAHLRRIRSMVNSKRTQKQIVKAVIATLLSPEFLSGVMRDKLWACFTIIVRYERHTVGLVYHHRPNRNIHRGSHPPAN